MLILGSTKSFLVWLVVTLLAAGFLIWTHHGQVRHVEYVSNLVGQSPAVAIASPTGLAGETRALIVPAHHRESYEWIAQTQRMIHRGEWRVRQIDYENAPIGRAVQQTSPYRWGIATVAWLDHTFSERPIGLSVERAALYGDPLLHLIFLLIASAFVAWQFGWIAGALVAVGIATMFPLAAGFLAGAPDDLGFAVIASFWSVLLLLPGVRALHAHESEREPNAPTLIAHRWFVAAGIMGGVALWISAEVQVPVVIGIAIGVLASRLVPRATPNTVPLVENAGGLWRRWAISGAITVLLAYLIEFSPSHLGSTDMGTLHPLYAFGWWGLGELLARVVGPGRLAAASRNPREIVIVLLALVAVASVPAMIWFGQSTGFPPAEGSAYQLTRLPDGITALNLWQAFTQSNGSGGQLLATLAPVVLLIVAAGWILRRSTGTADRKTLAFVFGPVLVSLVLASAYLSAWHLFDALIVILIAVGVSAQSSTRGRVGKHALWCGLVLLMITPGAVKLWPRGDAVASNAAPLLEVEGVVERDLARWLAKRIGDTAQAIVWAPPDVTNTLYFYGGVRGIGTFAPDNAAGLAASFQIARAGTHEEALALVRTRGITHIVLPAWEPFFPDTAELNQNQNAAPVGFLGGLQRWVLPSWLRPVAYQSPPAVRLENDSVQIFEVVAEQEPSLALSRLAEYFAETGDLEGAAWVDESLQRYPADLSALTARAHVLTARGETAGYTRVMDTLKARLRGRADRFLPWDRRVSLAIALAREQDLDRAREQTQRSLSEITEEKLRSLSPGMLFNFQLLNRALEMEISDPKLRELAKELLPVELQRHLERP